MENIVGCAATVLGTVLMASAGVSAQSGPASAQSDLASAQSDLAFAQTQAAVLRRCAAAAEKAGLPSAARPIYVEILAAYDPDDARAREALGYVRSGTQWVPSPTAPEPRADLLDPGASRRILSIWRGAAEELADHHARRSAGLAAEGRLEDARRHLVRALRFRPGDEKLEEDLRELGEGSTSTLESSIAERTAWIRSRVREELAREYETLDAPEHPVPTYVTAAGIETRCVTSEHYVIHGVHPVEVLREAAQHAERTRTLWKEIAPELCSRNRGQTQFVLLDEREDFVRILRTTPELVADDRRREFLIEKTSASTLGSGAERARVEAESTTAGAFDAVVRTVATTLSQTDSDFVEEGIGHVAVGWLFGKSLGYYVDLARARTTTDGRWGFLPPDMGSWPDLVVETAADQAKKPLLSLLIVDYSRFSAADRAGAWSVVDYLLRRDPALVFACDDSSRRGQIERIAVTFEKHTGIPIEVVEADWRRHCVGEWGAVTWGREGSSLLECATRDGERWLREIASLRRAIVDAKTDPIPDVGWSAARSTACMQHARYLLSNRRERGPDSEQTQDLHLPGSSVGGLGFAARALIGIGPKPERALAEWIHIPDYRDALLDPGLRIVGLFADRGVAVFDVRSEDVTGIQKETVIWPRDGASAIPRSFDVAELGAHVRAELERSDHGGQRVVGYPLTYHTWNGNSDWSSARCIAEQRGERLDGILLCEAGVRQPSTPGLLVFVPFDPFRTGEVEFRFEADFDWDGAFEELWHATFTTR